MSRTKIFSVLFIVCAGIIFLSACESNRWFQSEDKLRSKIQASWVLVRIPASRSPEEWTFREGKVYRDTGSVIMHYDTGNYSITTTLTKAFLSITDFQHTNEQYNAEWEIIELDKGLLYIATDHDGATGLKQLEFTEK